MSGAQSWSDTPAGILARSNGIIPGDDREERAQLRAEEQRELRFRWEQRMDAVDRDLEARGLLDRPWRVVRCHLQRVPYCGVRRSAVAGGGGESRLALGVNPLEARRLLEAGEAAAEIRRLRPSPETQLRQRWRPGYPSPYPE